MSRTTTFRMTTCALMLALPLGLTACGGTKHSDKNAAPAPASTSQAATPSTAPDSPATAESATSPDSATASASQPPADSGDKPAKDEVKAGLRKFYDGQPTAKTIDSQKMADCMVDKGYDAFSARTLTAMMNGDPKSADTADAGNIAKFGGECGATAMKMPS